MSFVLVVEDDETLLDAVAYNLERDGHEVGLAPDGVRGLALAREKTPDVIVLDVMLPRMSGVDVCRILRRESALPILMLTARDSEEDVVSGLDAGADDYMTKPFSMRELRARVNALLRRSARLAAATPHLDKVLVVGEIELDPRRHVVRKNGLEVSVRPKEFALLEYLMRNPDRLLTRDVLLDQVWGYSYAGESRTVDVHVRWLREKLEDDPSRPRHIQTIRGFGYRLIP
jgi:DNA-binding response OmpR family regulator